MILSYLDLNLSYFSKEDSEIANIRLIHKIDNKDFVFGFVGRLVRDKGISELVSSFLAINKIYKNTKLLLVGSYEDKLDPLDPWVKSEIETNRNILNFGYQNDVRPFYKAMNAFVFPSYREGFGVSLIEALSMELPVIASDIVGCNEIIQNDVNGILVPKKSIGKLTNAMQLLINDREKAFTLGVKGRESVSVRYDQNKVWENTLDAYKNL